MIDGDMNEFLRLLIPCPGSLGYLKESRHPMLMRKTKEKSERGQEIEMISVTPNCLTNFYNKHSLMQTLYTHNIPTK